MCTELMNWLVWPTYAMPAVPQQSYLQYGKSVLNSYISTPPPSDHDIEVK